MDINRNNYEAWFLDYVEHNLSEEQVALLMRFLEENPDLKAELEAFEAIELPEESTVLFPDKAQLKQELPSEKVSLITLENCDTYFIASMEGQLTPAEQEALEQFLAAHPEMEQELNSYARLTLTPASTTYPDKSFLKQVGPIEITSEEALFIGATENELNATEKQQLEALLLKDENAVTQLAAYQKTTLEAPLVMYPDKAALKQKERRGVVLPLWSYGAAAAVIAVLLWWTFGTGTIEPEDNTPLAVDDSPVETTNEVNDNEPQPANFEAVEEPLIADEQVVDPSEEKLSPKPQRDNIIPQKDPFEPKVVVHPLDSTKIKPTPNEVKQNPTVIVANNNNLQEDENNIVVVANEPVEHEFPTTRELIGKKVNKVLTGSETPGEAYANNADIAEVWADRIDNVTKSEVDFTHEKKADRVKWSVQLGKFGMSRSKSRGR